MASGVNVGDDINFWMFVARDDGVKDCVQLGNHWKLGHRERYISHVDTTGTPRWFTQKRYQYGRPLTFLYVKIKPLN